MQLKISKLVTIMGHLFPDKGLVLETFEDRLKLQKAIYLSQHLPLDLGYRFSWYVHGPYSPDLTETAFAYFEKKQDFDNLLHEGEVKLSSSGKLKLDKVKKLFSSKPADWEKTDTEWLELLASIHYLKHIAFLPEDITPLTIYNCREALGKFGKRHFTQDEIELAWNSLDQAGLINSKSFN